MEEETGGPRCAVLHERRDVRRIPEKHVLLRYRYLERLLSDAPGHSTSTTVKERRYLLVCSARVLRSAVPVFHTAL
jgi:hypothetical protein